jgi:hypothetical protein
VRNRHSCPIFMPGQSLIGSVATLLSSRVTWPEKPGPAEAGLSLKTPGYVVRQRNDLIGRGEHELTRVQDERLLHRRLDEAGQVGLLDSGIDVRVAVVLEHPKVLIDPDVDTGRLDHDRIVWIEHDAARRELGSDVAVGEQHARNLPVCRLRATGESDADHAVASAARCSWFR